MNHLKQNVTKYSGLPLSALIHLVETPAPVNELLKREVWKELFTRYYLQGRTFNLYHLLNKKPQMFANTIGWELQQEHVEIPSTHIESFIKNLIEFIEFVDKEVLKNGLQFEWQIHELKGLQSMIERVRDAKIKDANLRQKINLFIDKINETRKESLVLIEQKKKEQATSHELVAVNPSEVALLEEKKQLMQQELKHLSIPISKMNKREWEKSMEQLDIYYPKEQEKLIKHGLRKYDFFNYKHAALLAFKYNMTFEIPNVNMMHLLIYSASYLNQPVKVFGSDEVFYSTVHEFYLAAEGATEEGWINFSNAFLKRFHDDFSKSILRNRTLHEMKELYPYVQSLQGKPLSEVLRVTISENEMTSNSLTFDKELKKWVTEEKLLSTKTISVFEKIYQIFNKMRGHNNNSALIRYNIEQLPNETIQFVHEFDAETTQMIKAYCSLFTSLVIDNKTPLALKKSWNDALKTDGFSQDKNYLLQFLQLKFNSECMTYEELDYLFKTSEGLSFFNAVTNRMHFTQGWLKEAEDFIGKFYYRILLMFNFTNETELKQFFNLPLKGSDFFQSTNLKKEHLEVTIEKLRNELPHEYYLIDEYFSDINETYEEYKVHDAFYYLSDFERLLLEKEGIQTGETIKHEGYKEFGVYYTSEEANAKFVFDYFKKLHSND